MNHRMRAASLLLSLLLVVSATACNADRVPVPNMEPTDELPVQSPIVAVIPTSPEAAIQVPTPTTSADGFSVPSDQVERIQIEELKAMMDSGESVIILDVREVEYYRLNHIPGAISFPWKPTLTETDLEMVPPGEIIVTYCQCGPGEADSADMAWQLMNLGAKNIKTLAHPSIQGWISSDFPTE